MARALYDGLPPNLKQAPVLQPPTADDRMPGSDNTDNSNTQFATLALWIGIVFSGRMIAYNWFDCDRQPQPWIINFLTSCAPTE